MDELNTARDADQAMERDAAILFKHSTECPISANARREMESFVAQGAGGLPVYTVDVNARTDVSEHIAERTGIRHESPQVIVLRSGRPEWNASRFDITAGALRDALGLAAPGA
jgi:bacillithiol system protein YtxJ